MAGRILLRGFVIGVVAVVCTAPGFGAAADSVLSVAEARADLDGNLIPDRDGQSVTVAGRSNVYSGVMHTSRFSIFLQDSLAGIEVYNIDPGEPVAEGDSVIVTGKLEMYEGVTRITRAKYRVVKVDRPMMRALSLRVTEVLSERYEGMLVRVNAEVSRRWMDDYGAYLSLREQPEAPESLIVFLSYRHKSGIDFASLEPGAHVVITGILGQYTRGGDLGSGYEIYPRYPEDIRVIGDEERAYTLGALAAGGVAILALVWVVAMRREVKRRVRELQESERRFRNLMEDLQLVAITLDADSRISFINDYVLVLTGWRRHEVLGKDWFELFVPADAPNRDHLREQIRNGTVPSHYDGELLERGGKRRLIEWNNTVVRDVDGKPAGIAGIGEDVTERRRAEGELAASLQEKEVLLKEIHHRVKNNLQTVSSLLSLQAGSVKDPAIKELFLESQMRVRSMSLVHERLYLSKSLARVDFRVYLEVLLASLARSSVLTGNVHFETKMEEIALGADAAVTCGLIVNELISNSLKHAFPDGREGKVTITMHKGEGDSIFLTYTDDGVGLPVQYDPETAETLGMVLVTGLVQQLRGTMTVGRGEGAKFDIVFHAE